jgi:hypothetical protein
MCSILSIIITNQNVIYAGVSIGKPVGVKDQFFNFVRYIANLNLSIKKCVINIINKAFQEDVNSKKGNVYVIQCTKQAIHPSNVYFVLLVAIQLFWII